MIPVRKVLGSVGYGGGSGGSGNFILNGTTNPSSMLGNDGDFYINTTNSTLFGPKNAGSWGSSISLIGPAGADGLDGADGIDGSPGANGADGLDGADGSPGADGKTILNGAGAPSAGLGTTGDFYIDTTNSAIYGPKQGPPTDWGSPTSLIGPAGSPGANGADGTDGVDGADGTAITYRQLRAKMRR